MRNASCKKGWTMSCKEKLTHATSHSEVRSISTILSGIPALWHHQLFKSESWEKWKCWQCFDDIPEYGLLLWLAFPREYRGQDSFPFKRKDATFLSTFYILLSPLTAGVYNYSCLMRYWNKLPSRGSVEIRIKLKLQEKVLSSFLTFLLLPVFF